MKKADECVIVWSIEDVVSRAEDQGIEITTDQAQGILYRMKKNHDCDSGITWETIDTYLETLNNKYIITAIVETFVTKVKICNMREKESIEVRKKGKKLLIKIVKILKASSFDEANEKAHRYLNNCNVLHLEVNWLGGK